MNRKYVLGMLLLTLGFSLSACQKTPDEPVVVNKKDSKLEEAILSSDAHIENLKAETNWQEQLKSEDGSVTINIDAPVEIPETTEISVVSCMPHYFTQEEAKNAINIFYGDATLYDNSLSDQDWLASEIIKNKVDLEYLKKNGEYPEEEGETEDMHRIVPNLEEEIAWLEEQITMLEADYAAVSSQAAGIENIEMKESDSGVESINVRDGQTPPMQFYAFNDRNVNDAAIKYEITESDSPSVMPLDTSEEIEIGISREEAEAKALETASACGISQCAVVSVGKTKAGGILSYVFTLGRMIGGVPSIYISNYEGTQSFGTDGKEYREPWRQENIQVIVNDNGVVGFLWEYPPEILEVLNENVAIMPYEEIKEIARGQLRRSQTVDEFEMTQNDSKKVEINRVVLNMMRVAQKDSPDSYYYLPVWDFLGNTMTQDSQASGEAVQEVEKSFLTINGIDGSIIDRGLGY